MEGNVRQKGGKMRDGKVRQKGRKMWDKNGGKMRERKRAECESKKGGNVRQK